MKWARNQIALALFLALSLGHLSPAVSASTEGILPSETCRLVGNNVVGASYRYEDSGHIEDWSNILKPIGVLKGVLIPLDTPDFPHSSDLSKFREFADSIESEFRRLSSGRLNMQVDVLNRWITLPRSGADYMNSLGFGKNVMDALTTADPYVDFSKYDFILLKHDEKGSSVTWTGALPSLDPDQLFVKAFPDGIKKVTGAYGGYDSWSANGYGVVEMVHEIFHTFGLPDLYMRNPDGAVPVGVFDVMSNLDLKSNSRILGWHSWKLGWIDNSDVTCFSGKVTRKFTIPNTHVPKIVVLPISQDKVIVLERWQELTNSEPRLIAYEVYTKRYVWKSRSESGRLSPIQMLRPEGAPPASMLHGDGNRNASLSVGESIQLDSARIKLAISDQNGLHFTFTLNGEVEPKFETPAAKPSPDQASPKVFKKKLITITCTSAGSKKKIKVTAVNPKCPKGFKRK